MHDIPQGAGLHDENAADVGFHDLLLIGCDNLADHVAGGVILAIARYSNLTTIGPNALALGYRLLGIIRAFGMNSRPKYIEHAPDIRLIEHHDMIYASKRRDKSCAFAFIEDGTIRAFDCADRTVTVDRHDKSIAQLTGAFEISHMANVQNVKAAIGENDGLAA